MSSHITSISSGNIVRLDTELESINLNSIKKNSLNISQNISKTENSILVSEEINNNSNIFNNSKQNNETIINISCWDVDSSVRENYSNDKKTSENLNNILDELKKEDEENKKNKNEKNNKNKNEKNNHNPKENKHSKYDSKEQNDLMYLNNKYNNKKYIKFGIILIILFIIFMFITVVFFG
jgi:Fe2+ transport system protein B